MGLCHNHPRHELEGLSSLLASHAHESSAHLVPVVLLVGEHQEAPIIDEDTDEVLGKEGSVTQPRPCPGQGRSSKVRGGSLSGRGASEVSPSLRSISVPGAPVLGAGSRRHHPPWGSDSPLRGSTVHGATTASSSLRGGLGLAELGEQQGTGWVHRLGKQGTGTPPSHSLLPHQLPPPLPITHLVVGLAVHLTAAGGVTLPAKSRAEGHVSRMVTPPELSSWPEGTAVWCPQRLGTGTLRNKLAPCPSSAPQQAELPPCAVPTPVPWLCQSPGRTRRVPSWSRSVRLLASTLNFSAQASRSSFTPTTGAEGRRGEL